MSVVLFRVLCETVKEFVSKVGSASATSDPSEVDDPDSLAQKVSASAQRQCVVLASLFCVPLCSACITSVDVKV